MVVTDQELGGGGIEVVLGNVVLRKAEVSVGDVQDVPLLGVQLAQKDHALQNLHRRLVDGRQSKRSVSKLFLGEELSDCNLGRKLLDAREHLVLRQAHAEHVQRQVVLGVRRNKSFQSVGGAAQLDEAREAMLPECVAAVDQQVVDIGVVAEAHRNCEGPCRPQ